MLLKLLAVLVSLAYPFLVYFMLQHVGGGWLLPLMFALLLWRLLSSQVRSEKITLAVLIVVMGATIITLPTATVVKLYPAMMNLAMLALFAASLYQGPSLIEQLARLREPNLPAQGVRYTRQVTQVWVGFFVINGTAALVTAIFMSDQAWLLYNGFIAYLLMGLLFAGEWLVRIQVKKKYHEHG